MWVLTSPELSAAVTFRADPELVELWPRLAIAIDTLAVVPRPVHMAGCNRASGVFRGQHPHAVNDFMRSTGPETWSSPVEVDRITWEEQYVDELAAGLNPIAHYEAGIEAGQDLDTRNKIKRMEEIEALKRSVYAKANPGTSSQASVWTPTTPPASKSGSPPRNPFNITSEGQRLSRALELAAKLGVDKVKLHEKSVIDTTAQAGHNTAALPFEDPDASGKTTLRGGTWPTTDSYYVNAGGQ